jgi:hypothetical protein
MCAAKATTTEHVPPRSFFPKGYREQLFVVPSCENHNNDNSLDVEYVKSLIVHSNETNSVARDHFKNSVLRSYVRRPNFSKRLFKNRKPIIVNGEETIVFQIESDRFENVIRAISLAIFFKDFGKRYNGDWIIFSPSMVSTRKAFDGKAEPHIVQMREMISRLPFVEKEQVIQRCLNMGNSKIVKMELFITLNFTRALSSMPSCPIKNPTMPFKLFYSSLHREWISIVARATPLLSPYTPWLEIHG